MKIVKSENNPNKTLLAYNTPYGKVCKLLENGRFIDENLYLVIKSEGMIKNEYNGQVILVDLNNDRICWVCGDAEVMLVDCNVVVNG